MNGAPEGNPGVSVAGKRGQYKTEQFTAAKQTAARKGVGHMGAMLEERGESRCGVVK